MSKSLHVFNVEKTTILQSYEGAWKTSKLINEVNMIISYENLYVILCILNLFTAISIYPISVDQGRGQGQVKDFSGARGGGDETKVHETKILMKTKLMRNTS